MTGTRSRPRRPNMSIARRNPYVRERAARTFADGPLATPIEGDMTFLSLNPALNYQAAKTKWDADIFMQSIDKLPLLCKALGIPAPPKRFDHPDATIKWAVVAILIAQEYVPGFRSVLDPFPRQGKKSRHGKSREDEKYALEWFWLIRNNVKTDREAWATYAEIALDKSLASPNRTARQERDRIARNLEIRMSPLVSAQRQQKKAGRPQ